MIIDPEGYCSAATSIPSPNCDDRPPGMAVELIVIHNISLPPGIFGGPEIIELFTNRLDAQAHPYFAGIASLRVSAHFLIRRDGALLQFVPCSKRAWHAGESNWQGRTRCNDFSIGIELEGCDSSVFEDAQYATLATLSRAICVRYPIVASTGHADIAPGRKTDPGPHFDWVRYHSALKKQ